MPHWRPKAPCLPMLLGHDLPGGCRLGFSPLYLGLRLTFGATIEDLGGSSSNLSAEFPLVFHLWAIHYAWMAFPSFHAGTLAVKRPRTVWLLVFTLSPS